MTHSKWPGRDTRKTIEYKRKVDSVWKLTRGTKTKAGNDVLNNLNTELQELRPIVLNY
jgi:hypothetical protein